jgi:hypothetical protein
MEPRNTRPGGSVYPVKNRTAPGFPSTKAKTKNYNNYGPHDLHGRAAFLLNPEKKKGTAADSTDRSPPKDAKE